MPCGYLLRANITSLIQTVPLRGPYFEQYIIFYVCVLGLQLCSFIIRENLLYVIIIGCEQPFEQGLIFLIIRGVRAARSYHFRIVPQYSAGQWRYFQPLPTGGHATCRGCQSRRGRVVTCMTP